MCSLDGASCVRSSCWDIPVWFFAGAFCMFSFSFEGGFFRALFHKIFAPAVVPGYIFLGLFCRGSCRAQVAGRFLERNFLRAFSGLLFHGVFFHALFFGVSPVFFRRCFLHVPFLSLRGLFQFSFGTVSFCALSRRSYSLALDCRVFSVLLFCLL